MSRKKYIWVIWIVLLAGVILMFSRASPSALAAVTCNNWKPLSMNTDKSFSISGTTCYQIIVPPRRARLTIALEPFSGQFNLYLAPGKRKALLNDIDHKLNFLLPIAPGRALSTYAFKNPSGGYYTIAVEPRSSGNNRFHLKISTEKLISQRQLSASAAGDTEVANARFPSSAVTNEVDFDLGPGVQAIFPFEATCPGKIKATASEWGHYPETLTMILNGPQGQEYLYRESGSPLAIEYTVTWRDVQQGKRWWLTLANFSNNVAKGNLNIEYPGRCESLWFFAAE
jgi:hypothetical protein